MNNYDQLHHLEHSVEMIKNNFKRFTYLDFRHNGPRIIS